MFTFNNKSSIGHNIDSYLYELYKEIPLFVYQRLKETHPNEFPEGPPIIPSCVFLIGEDLYRKKTKDLTSKEAEMIHERFSEQLFQLFVRIAPYSIFNSTDLNYNYRINTPEFSDSYNRYRFIYFALNPKINPAMTTNASMTTPIIASQSEYHGSSSWRINDTSRGVGNIVAELYFGGPSNNSGIFGFYLHNQGFQAGFHGEQADTFTMLFSPEYRQGYVQGQLWDFTFDVVKGSFELTKKAGSAAIDLGKQAGGAIFDASKHVGSGIVEVSKDAGSIIFNAGKEGIQFIGKELPNVVGKAGDFIGKVGDIGQGIVELMVQRCDQCGDCGANLCQCVSRTASTSVHNAGNVMQEIGRGVGCVIKAPFQLCGEMIKLCGDCCGKCDGEILWWYLFYRRSRRQFRG